MILPPPLHPSTPPPFPTSPQIQSCQEELEGHHATLLRARLESSEAEAAAGQALEAGHGEVMALREVYVSLQGEVAGLGRERDALAAQLAAERDAWAARQAVGGSGGGWGWMVLRLLGGAQVYGSLVSQGTSLAFMGVAYVMAVMEGGAGEECVHVVHTKQLCACRPTQTAVQSTLQLIQIPDITHMVPAPLPPPPLPWPPQAEEEVLAGREAALASERAQLTAEMEALLNRQEERLRAWEGAVAGQEAALEARRAAADQEVAR